MGRMNLSTIGTAVDAMETVIAAAGIVIMAADLITDRRSGGLERNRIISTEKAARGNHSNQLNPNSRAFKAARDNRANQMNPNNPVYWKSRRIHHP